MTEPSRLLEPRAIGELRLANRVFMAPLTRCRSQEVTPASLARKDSPRPQQGPDAVFVADG